MAEAGDGDSRMYFLHQNSMLTKADYLGFNRKLRKHELVVRVGKSGWDNLSPFGSERQMHDLVEANIGTLFPGLALLGKFEMDGGKRLPDTIAFDGDQNTFVVLEYKNKRDRGAVDQARAYLNSMKKNRKRLVQLHNRRAGHHSRSSESFEWEMMYAIIIAPEFSGYQIEGASGDPNVELYEFGRYGERVMRMTRVGGGHKSSPPDPGGEAPKEGGEGQPDPWHSRVGARLADEFPRAAKEKRERYTVFRHPGEFYHFCALAPTPSGTWIFYSGSHAAAELRPDSFVRDAESLFASADCWGRYCSRIKDEDDVKRALAILRRLRVGVHAPTQTGPPPPPCPDDDYAPQEYLDAVVRRRREDALTSGALEMLLDEFPGVVKGENERYIWFRHPGEDGHFCTLALTPSGTWIFYSGSRAASELRPDAFVRDAESLFASADCWGEGKYCSKIENADDMEKALDVLGGLYDRDHEPTEPGQSPRDPDDEGEGRQSIDTRSSSQVYLDAAVRRRRKDALTSSTRKRLQDEFPGSVKGENERYIWFQHPGKDGHFCTLAMTHSGTWIFYSGSHAASKLRPDGFVQSAKSLHSFGDYWGEGSYCSKIESGADIERAVAILSMLHAAGREKGRANRSSPDPEDDASQAGRPHSDSADEERARQADGWHSAAHARLLHKFPGTKEHKEKNYTGFRRPDEDGYFCTLALTPSGTWIFYSGSHAAAELRPDSFVRDAESLFASADFRGEGKYCSKIESGDDIKRALAILKELQRH